jgi:serine/threonine protein kinase/tetratricopeptide (TPR) repeat protein
LPELQEHLAAVLQDRYAIQREIGHGGMAVVYLARDLKHDREVALKVLYRHLSAALGAERFLREIRVAARLQHPHVLPLYDSGEADGSLYYVVPYVAGGSLRDRLRRESPLPLTTAIQIAREVADGLDYAHRQNVVHRDIKPENILLEEGHAVIADFGVARAISEAAETQLTEAGLLVGTPAYMSPEQALGQAVDGRSDIYGLGCVLFELLSGAPPFTGHAPLVTLVQRVSDPAPRLSDRGIAVPPQLEDALGRALAQHPKDRLQTAAEFGRLLSTSIDEISIPAVATPGGQLQTARPVGLAVLPFVNMSSDPENEYFSDGMTEELINALTKVTGLRVTARTSAFVFKGKDIDVREIGRKLNVESVLEGSVRRAGKRLRITAQLVNVADGYYVWSETFDRGIADVFAVQDELSRAITASLKVHLTEPNIEPPTENFDAYTLYLKGLYALNRRTVEGYREAVAFFNAALEKDPAYALPHAGVAHAYAMLGFDWYGGLSSLEAMPLAKESATRALELDENLAEAHTALAIIRMLFEWDWAGAEASFRRAIEINPGYAPAHNWFSLFLSTRNRHPESLREIRKAQELDPLSIIINQNLGRAYHHAGRYDEAVEQYRRTLELEPRFFTAHVMLAQSLSKLSRYEEAVAALRTALAVVGRVPLILAELAFVLAKTGELEEPRRLLGELTGLAQRQYVSPYCLWTAHFAVGEEEAAFDLIEAAYEQRSTILPFMGTDTTLGSLHRQPRYVRLLEKLDLPNQVSAHA